MKELQTSQNERRVINLSKPAGCVKNRDFAEPSSPSNSIKYVVADDGERYPVYDSAIEETNNGNTFDANKYRFSSVEDSSYKVNLSKGFTLAINKVNAKNLKWSEMQPILFSVLKNMTSVILVLILTSDASVDCIINLAEQLKNIVDLSPCYGLLPIAMACTRVLTIVNLMLTSVKGAVKLNTANQGDIV